MKPATRLSLGGIDTETPITEGSKAFLGGQYKFSTGLAFGGFKKSWSRATVENIFLKYLSFARHIVLLDFHTGLGEYGDVQIILRSPPESEEQHRLKSWLVSSEGDIAKIHSATTDLLGDGLNGMRGCLTHAEVTAGVVEFGTRDPMTVLQALRADTCLHEYGEVLSPLGTKIKQQVRDAWYCDDDLWKDRVIQQAEFLIDQIVYGLSAGGEFS